MIDQAQDLRDLVQPPQKLKSTRIIAITSGKGGAGKSNFTLNFALALQASGYRVLVCDCDIGFANIDVLMGVSPKFSLYHLLHKEKTLDEIVYEGNYNLKLIAGGSGFSDLLQTSGEQLDTFIREVCKLSEGLDFILFDTAAGLSKDAMKFILAAREAILVVTPEPTSITDSYAVVKMIHAIDPHVKFQMVVNRTGSKKEGKQTANKINMVAKQFLNLDISTLGFIDDDSHVSKAVKKQIPFYIAYPNSSASLAMIQLTNAFLSSHHGGGYDAKGVKGFLSKFIQLLKT